MCFACIPQSPIPVNALVSKYQQCRQESDLKRSALPSENSAPSPRPLTSGYSLPWWAAASQLWPACATAASFLQTQRFLAGLSDLPLAAALTPFCWSAKAVGSLFPKDHPVLLITGPTPLLLPTLSVQVMAQSLRKALLIFTAGRCVFCVVSRVKWLWLHSTKSPCFVLWIRKLFSWTNVLMDFCVCDRKLIFLN